MTEQKMELMGIIEKFAGCGWDVIDGPAKAWLENKADPAAVEELAAAVEKADELCGSCGCEFDPLCKRALELLHG